MAEGVPWFSLFLLANKSILAHQRSFCIGAFNCNLVCWSVASLSRSLPLLGLSCLSHFLLLPVSACVSVSLAISLFFAVTLAVRLNKAAVGVLCWRAFFAVDPGHWNSLYAQFLSLLSFLQSYSSPNIRLDSFLLLSLYCKIWSFGDLFFLVVSTI